MGVRLKDGKEGGEKRRTKKEIVAAVVAITAFPHLVLMKILLQIP